MGVQNLYQVARWFYIKKFPMIPRMIYYIQYFLFNCHVPYKASIGEGTKFAYGGIGVVIHDRAIIGKNTIIGTNVTIGGRSGLYGVPEIGDNVYIATGAVIIGPVKIGNNSIIGANSVVISNVEMNEVVAGVPAKHIKYNI